MDKQDVLCVLEVPCPSLFTMDYQPSSGYQIPNPSKISAVSGHISYLSDPLIFSVRKERYSNVPGIYNIAKQR